MYVRFILRIYPVYYKTRLLFKEENWQLVDDFVFNHHLLQLELVQSTTPDEYKTIKNKFKFYQYCISKKIQTPEVLAVIENGEFTYQKVDDFIPHTTLFVKNLSGGKGKNTAKFDFENGGYIDNQKNKYSRLSLKKKLESVSIKKGPVLIQPVLSNHGSWRPFTSGGLATCRIVTARSRDDEKIIPMFGCFRMPVGDSVADNYSLGGIIAPVDLSTGKVGVGVSSKPINGKFEFIHHPDTQHQFEGEILPYWTDLLEFTLDVHKYFKTIFVGWDVSLTTNGCTMIEGNIGWASGSYEIPFQDPLKNTIYPELFEKWMEKYQ